MQPSRGHLPVERYVHPDEFGHLRQLALDLGFAHVEAGPLVRSSYHAEQQSAALDKNRLVDFGAIAPGSSRSQLRRYHINNNFLYIILFNKSRIKTCCFLNRYTTKMHWIEFNYNLNLNQWLHQHQPIVQ